MRTDLNGIADGVFSDLTSGYQETVDGTTVSLPGIGSIVPNNMSYAVVATRETVKSPVMTLAVRAVRKGQERTLFAQPVYFTEVHFQGKID